MLPVPLNSQMDVPRYRSLEKKVTLVNNYIHNLCIFKIRVFRLSDGLLKDNPSTDGKTLIYNITEYHWIYESRDDKLYCLARIGNNCIFVRIRMGYEDQPSMRIVIADTYDELTKNIMSERIYKKYKRDMI